MNNSTLFFTLIVGMLVFGCASPKCDSIPDEKVTIIHSKEVEKKIEYEYEQSRAPNYCRYFGGTLSGPLGLISCSFYDMVPNKVVTGEEIIVVYELTLNIGEILYTKKKFEEGVSINLRDIPQVKLAKK